MSTAPVSTQPPVTTGFITAVSAYAPIAKDLTWLQKHERIVLAVIAGLVLWFGIGKVDTLIQHHDNANLQQAQVVDAQQAATNKALADNAAFQAQQYKALAEQVAVKDAQLEQLQATLVTTLAAQQKTDATLPPMALVARWNALVPEASVSIINGQIIETQAGAVATVQELEKSPVLTQQLAASNEELANANKLVAAEGQQVTSLTALVAGLQAKATDDAKVCSTQIAVVKADARKSKRRWFYAGVVVGFIGRQLIKTETGF